MLSIMLAIASSPKSVVAVDEIENGIFHTHYAGMWRTIVSLLIENESQLFVSTHSDECLRGLLEVDPLHYDKMKLFRTTVQKNKFVVKEFSGRTFVSGIRYGEEIRG